MSATLDDRQAIRDGVAAACKCFDDSYWPKSEEEARFPVEFYQAMASEGRLGTTMPEEYTDAGLGVTEAAIVVHKVARFGSGMAAASSFHINMFGQHLFVFHGPPEKKAKGISRLIQNLDQVSFGVTEPNTGPDTTNIRTFATKVKGGYRLCGRKILTSTAQVANKILLLTRTLPRAEVAKPTQGLTIFYTDLDKSRLEVRKIPEHGRAQVNSNMVFIDDYFIPDEHLIGEEGKGFSYLLDSLNPERVLVAIEAIGIGQDALERAARYGRERQVFGRGIGQDQGIQHPLAECWINLKAAELMAKTAAELYDSGRPCGAEANSAKFLGARASHNACLQAVLTHGGRGYAREYQVERLLREVLVTLIAPVSEQMILSSTAERVLEQPKSY